MSEDRTNQPREISEIQADLNASGLSRRKFLDRLKALGVGFGAAAVAGEAVAREATDKTVTLKSTNPALDGIVTEGRQESQAATGKDRTQVAQYFYRRFYRRGYRRFYRRYGRFYRPRRFYYRRFF